MSCHPDVLSNSFMKAGFNFKLNEPIVHSPEGRRDTNEDFAFYVSIVESHFDDKIARLDINDK